MSNRSHSSGQVPCSHGLPNTAPKPSFPDESVYSLSARGVPISSRRNKDLPLKDSRNFPRVILMWWNGFAALWVRVYALWRNALPGTMALQAKFRCRSVDCSSLKVVVLLHWYCISALHISSLSCGSYIVELGMSRSMPRMVRNFAGPSVFSWAMVKSSCRSASMCDGAIMRKSSRMWTMCLMPSLLKAIHCNVVENFSKIEQDIEQPMGRVVS